MDELKTLVDHYSANVLQGKSIVIIRLEILAGSRIVRQDMWTNRQEQNNSSQGLKTTLWKQTETADFWAAFLEQPGPPLSITTCSSSFKFTLYLCCRQSLVNAYSTR